MWTLKVLFYPGLAMRAVIKGKCMTTTAVSKKHCLFLLRPHVRTCTHTHTHTASWHCCSVVNPMVTSLLYEVWMVQGLSTPHGPSHSRAAHRGVQPIKMANVILKYDPSRVKTKHPVCAFHRNVKAAPVVMVTEQGPADLAPAPFGRA